MALRLARHLDLVVLVIALPLFVAAGFPIAGWAVGSGVYLVQWLVREATRRRAARSADPRTVAGLLAGSMVGRGFFATFGILAVGLANRHAGLAAAVLFLFAFSIAFTLGLALRPFDRSGP